MNTPDYANAAVLFAGRPNTGKTTYLALLYAAIVDNRAEQLELGAYTDDREYLNNISDQLRQCQPAARTKVADHKELALSLLVGPNRESLLLCIPDLSGETWDTALLERQWATNLDAQIKDATAAVIFVHPQKEFDSGTTVIDAALAHAALQGPSDPLDAESPTERVPYSHSPTQVEIIDLLQLLLEQRGGRPARGCLIISAYDMVPDSLPPGEWLRENCPMVDQYLEANGDWLDFAVWGVSAQGGQFTDEAMREELAKQGTLERAVIRDGNGARVRPEDPILWALGYRD